MKKKINIIIFLIILLIFPTAGFAAKQVSQQFGDNVTYFPANGGKAYILTDGQFYFSSQPDTAIDWKKTEKRFTRADGNSPYFNSLVSVYFAGYDYITTAIDTGGERDFSFDPTITEIWRFSRTNTPKLERVLLLSGLVEIADGTGMTQRTFEKLFVFKNTLYAGTSNGELWKTKNGATWTEVKTTGLPTDGYILDAAISNDYIYILNAHQIYRSKNGKTWNLISGKYQREGLIDDIEILQDNLYVVTRTQSDEIKIWRQTNKNKWKTIRQAAEGHAFSMFTDVAALYLIDNETDKNIFTIFKSNKKISKFKQLYKASGEGKEMIVTSEKKLFLVTNEDYQYYLLRTP